MERKTNLSGVLFKVCILFIFFLLNLSTNRASIVSGQSPSRIINISDEALAKHIILTKCQEYAAYRFHNYTAPTLTTFDIIQNISQLNCTSPKCDGKPAAPQEYPHMALLFYKENITEEDTSSKQCSGTLISEQFILSSAYCSVDINGNQVKWAGLGLTSREEYIADYMTKKNIFKIKYYINHPVYKEGTENNDIALYKLANAITLTPYIRPICIHTKPLANDVKVGIMRWGRTRDTIADYVHQTDWLLNEIIHTRNKRSCQRVEYDPYSYRNEKLSNFDESRLICGGPKFETENICEGDMGGPMQKPIQDMDCMWVQVGITAMGPKSCALMNAKSYTRVSAYSLWIQRNVWPENINCYD